MLFSQRSRSKAFYKIGAFKIFSNFREFSKFAKFTFLNKVAGLQAATLLKRDFETGIFLRVLQNV